MAWTWRRASRAEQLLSAVIVFNVAMYIISVMPLANVSRELAALLPSGAVLAARGLVPARVTGRLTAVAAVAATAVIALLTLSAAAARPTLTPATAPLSAWLEAHGLRYGVAGYWDASITTVESGNKVQLRAIDLHPHPDAPQWTVNIPGWESNPLWYNPSTYDATFAVADVQRQRRRAPRVSGERSSSRSSASRRPGTGSTAGTSWFTRRTYCAKLAPYCPDRGAASGQRAYLAWRARAPRLCGARRSRGCS